MNLVDEGLQNFEGDDIYREFRNREWEEEKRGKEILDEKARKYASELVAIKAQLNDRIKEEKRLKGKLREHMEQYSKITLDDWVVKCRYHKTPASFDRLTVLTFLEKEYGLALRNQVDYMCSKKEEINRLTICVSPNVKPRGANGGQPDEDDTPF